MADIKKKKFEKLKRPAFFEFQKIGLELQKIYGKGIWSLFHKPYVTNEKIWEAHQRAKKRGVQNIAYLIAIIKKL